MCFLGGFGLCKVYLLSTYPTSASLQPHHYWPVWLRWWPRLQRKGNAIILYIKKKKMNKKLGESDKLVFLLWHYYSRASYSSDKLVFLLWHYRSRASYYVGSEPTIAEEPKSHNYYPSLTKVLEGVESGVWGFSRGLPKPIISLYFYFQSPYNL